MNALVDHDDNFLLDMNDDGIDDFRLANSTYLGFTNSFGYTDYWRADIEGLNGSIAINPVGDFGFVAQRFASSVIDNAQLFGPFPTLRGHSLYHTSFSGQNPYYFGSFTGNGFAGVRFEVNGANHFGWIQLNVNGGAREYSVIDWAYENVPNMSILAGDIGGDNPVGDYNGNGTVGPEDYTVWKNSFGQNVTAGTGADGNSNAKVDAADYTVWRDHLNTSGGGALSGTVPEPSTVTLGVLALGATGVAALRRSSTRRRSK